MSKVSHKHHSSHPARATSQPHAKAAQAPAPPPAKPKTVQLPPRVQDAPKNATEAFKRLDRNNDHVIDFEDFERKGVKAKNHKPAIPGKADKGRMNLDEFKDYARTIADTKNIKIPVERHSNKPKEHEHRIEGGKVFMVPQSKEKHDPKTPQGAVNMRTPQGATVRTDPSGLVIGRLGPGDRFVATHKKGPWYYGYVNGDPKRKGWVMDGKGLDPADSTARERQLIRHPPEHAPKHMVHQNGITRGPDGSNTDGFVTSGEKRYNAIVRDLESRFEVDQKTKRLGYTQPLRLQHDAQVLKGLDGKPLINTDGKPITLPAGSKVGFRYTPDGEHAVVMLNRGTGSGLWALVKMDDINWSGLDRSKVPGATTPKHPISWG